MKLVKKWLFPVLICLITAGAAVLPAHISQMRDVRLFGQVHTEHLDANPLPVREGPTLLDRMVLYSGRYDSGHPILSFRDPAYFEDSEGKKLVQTAQELLTGAHVLPAWIFREEPFDQMAAERLLLWDPVEEAVQEPTVFWELSWSYYSNKSHQKSIDLAMDADTGLPIRLYVGDTNMSQWLPYKTKDLRALAERFFALLGVEVREVEPFGSGYDPSLNLSYIVTGTPLAFHISRHPTGLSIQLGLNMDRTDASSPTDG